MDRYCLYEVELKKRNVVQGDITEGMDTQKTDMSTAYEYFESFFDKPGRALDIFQMNKATITKTKSHPNRVLAVADHVILFQLNNVQIKKLWKPINPNTIFPTYIQTQEESNPYCNVIIDNRGPKCIMAIQVDHSAWSSTDKVRDVLQDNLSRMLESRGLEIEINSKMKPSRFWDYVNYKKRYDKCGIKRLTWDFINSKRQESTIKPRSHIKAIDDMTDLFNGMGGQFTIFPSQRELLELNRRRVDMINMLDLASDLNNIYYLTVTFSDGEVYKCNSYIRAEIQMPESYVNNFKDNFKEAFFEFELFRWLDEARIKTENYQNAEQTKRKGKRKNS